MDQAAIARGDALSAARRYTEAAVVYREVADRGATDELRARALFELGRLANDPQNPEREWRRAIEYLDRLRHEYPTSRWAAYARSWQSTLDELRQLQSEAAQKEQEILSLRQQLRALDELRQLRGEAAKKEQEVLSLRQQLRELTGEVMRSRDAVRELERLRQRLADVEREAANMQEALQRLKALEMELDQRERRR